MKWAHSLSSISAYKRCEAHLTTKTTHGAIVTLFGILLGLTLTVHEVSWFMSGGGVTQTAVDLARRHDLGIHIDISFPAIPCAGLSMDVMDASGSTGNDVSKGKDVNLHKIRLDPVGRKVGGRQGEYHTPQSQKLVQDQQGMVMQIDLGAAMSQMSDMERELQGHEGCRVIGDISVRRVAGKLHFAVHQQSFVDVLPQMLTGHVLPKLVNMSHVINKVAFGPEFPGQVNPLDGFNRVTKEGDALRAYKYFLKIVPTEYMSRLGFVLETNQYSVNEYMLNLAGQQGAAHPSNDTSAVATEPFVDFSYDMSPIMMTVAASPSDLLHFIVRMCAVVGGVLSITRMLDKLVHSVLVASGVVVLPPSIKAKHSSGGFGSQRSSFAGSLVDSLLNSPPGSARSSYAGSGSLPHENAYHRRGPGHSNPGSHPLSTHGSNASSLAAMGSLGGSGPGGVASPAAATNGSLPSSGAGGGASAYGALAGGYGGGSSSQGGGYGGSQAGGAGGFGTGSSNSMGGFGPAGIGPLYKAGSGGSLGVPGVQSQGPSSRGISIARGGMGGSHPLSGGFGSDPGAAGPVNPAGAAGRTGSGTAGLAAAAGGVGRGLAGAGGSGGSLAGFGSGPLAAVLGGSSGGAAQGLANGFSSSRLSSASGPGSRPASGAGMQPQPLARGLSNMAPGNSSSGL